jgi:hypothetical protein
MLDPFSLCRAFADVHGVFSVQTWRGPGGVEAEKEMGFNVVQCAADAGVPHLVYSSVASANRTDLAHFLSKYEIEQRIAMLGVPATILRPVFFMDNFSMQAEGIRAGRLVQGVKPETRLQMIAVDDIGGIATLAFSSPHHWRGKTFEFAGDELTLVQAAEIFSARLGRPVEYVPEHEDRPGGGDEARRMATWFDEVGYNLYIAGVREVYPALKDFRAFVAQADWLDESGKPPVSTTCENRVLEALLGGGDRIHASKYYVQPPEARYAHQTLDCDSAGLHRFRRAVPFHRRACRAHAQR